MLYCAKINPNVFSQRTPWLLVFLILGANALSASTPPPIDHSIHHQQLLMQGQVSVELPQTIHQAIQQEIPILFKTQITLTQQRDFVLFKWPKRLTQIDYQTELRYSHFYQTYSLHNLRNGNRLSFSELDEALKVLGYFQNFPIIELSQLHAGLHYELSVSIGIDWRKLSTPLFNQALFNPDWQYNTGSLVHNLRLGAGS